MSASASLILTRALTRSRHDERGATAVEYGLLIALIAGVIVGVVTALGLALPDGFQDVIDQI